VLKEEGLELDDLKARLLKRAYLPKANRRLLVFPSHVETVPSTPDRLVVKFNLPPGSYATLVLKTVSLRSTPS
ncbi:MAG: tRNA pseudouridine(13) synthase TruD, partial [SAR202 cluster bacterium]|nr:tRNA pseudouridine(13) synthase TruD [SAR202 cluster bacterium]